MKKLPTIIKADKKIISGELKQVLFDKGLTSKDDAKVISLQVQLLQTLGSDIKIISSSVAGEIIGLVGDEADITEVLKYHDITWKKN